MLYILETDKPPPTFVLVSFATSLIYLGCASLVICCASSELAMSRGPSAESAWHVTFCGGHRTEVQVQDLAPVAAARAV